MADTIAGRYTLIDPIARGGSGAVWRAWDGRLQQLCAAKVLRQRDSADLLRFAREQSVKLDHPHVLAPYGWAAEDAHVVIAMPLVHGGTLESALLDNGAASVELTEEVLAQLLQALQFVHAQGWVHRDVKPGNLMLDSTGTGRPHVLLSDFGIAVRVQDARLTRTGTVVGTPGYLPPEAYALTDPNAAQDLYAAGITALRMLDPALEPQESLGPNDARAVAGGRGDLAEHLAALLTPDPGARRDAAVAVLHELTAGAARRHFDPALTRDGEPFEVFDVLEPLPEPWADRVRTGWAGTGAGAGGGAAGVVRTGAEERGAGAADPGAVPPDGPETVDTVRPADGPAPRSPAGSGTAVTVRTRDDGAARDDGAVGSGPGGDPVDRDPVGRGNRRAAGASTAALAAPPTRARRRAVTGLFVALVGATAMFTGYLLLDPLGAADQVPAPGATPTVTRSTGPSPNPERSPVQLERVCEDRGGGEERCYFRAS